MCSMISSTVDTFDDKVINLDESIKTNCSVLLVADCSTASRFAIFATPHKIDSVIKSFTLELHVDAHTVKYSPSNNEHDFIRLEDSTEIEVNSLINPLGGGIEFR